MPRAQFQVLVIPFVRQPGGEAIYCVLRRADADYWQWVAGGGEDDETPSQAARREASEEAGPGGELFALSTTSSIPVDNFAAHVIWPPDLYVIPEYSFAIEMPSKHIVLSLEHTEMRWGSYEEPSRCCTGSRIERRCGS